MSLPQPTRRSETYLLALAFAGILALLLVFLAIIAWKSPFVIFRLPERTTQTGSAAPTL